MQRQPPGREGRRNVGAIADHRVLLTFTVSDSLVFVNGLARFLRERGWDPGFASSGGPELSALSAAGFATFEMPFSRTSSVVHDFSGVRALRRVIREWRPAIIHANTPKAGALTMLAALGLPGHRLYHMRGLPLESALGVARIPLWLAEFAACRIARTVLCVSESLLTQAVAHRLLSRRKGVVLGYGSGQGVDCTRFVPDRAASITAAELRAQLSISHDAFVFGFVGRFATDKGIVELTEAWAQVSDELRNAHLVLFGAPDSRQDTTAIIERLRRLPRTHIRAQTHDMPTVYAALNALVLPTYREGLPNVLLEAGAMALPVIATAVTGCVDVVRDGETGHLVPVRDPAALAFAMRRYVEDPELARLIGAQARADICVRFAQQDVWRRLEAFYAGFAGTPVSPIEGAPASSLELPAVRPESARGGT